MTTTYTITYNPRTYGYDIKLKGKRVENVLTLCEAIAYATTRNAAYKVTNRMFNK